MAVKKKILIVNDLLLGGGVEKLIYDLVWKWHDKYDLTIMTDTYADEFENLYPDNVQYISAPIETKWAHNLFEKILYKVQRKILVKKFYRDFSRMKFDIVLALKEGWTLKKVAEMDIPLKFAWVHTDYNSYHYTYDIFGGLDNERRCMQKFKNVICVSEVIRKSIIDVIGDPGNLTVRYNPIDVRQILEKAQEPVVDVDPLETTGVLRFVTVGRLNYQKGYNLLLEACHMLERDGLKFEVWIIGGEEPWGDEHHRLYRAQKRLGVKSVKFFGGRKNPYKYMKCADWFLSSSIFEGYSLVSQEAAVLDVPLLLTDCSGVRELLGDSEYGIVMKPSVLGIYEGMKRVIEQPQLGEYYRNKIKERKWTIQFEERIAKIEELFLE